MKQSVLTKKLLIGAFLIATLSNGFGQKLKLEPIEVVWTNEIDSEGNCKTKFIDSAPVGQLFFWMKFSCNQEATKILLSHKKLPLKYKWFQKVGISWIARGITLPHDSLQKKLPIDTTQLKSLVWKSWSGKSKEDLKKGKWRVSVRLPDDTLITESTIKIYED